MIQGLVWHNCIGAIYWTTLWCLQNCAMVLYCFLTFQSGRLSGLLMCIFVSLHFIHLNLLLWWWILVIFHFNVWLLSMVFALWQSSTSNPYKDTMTYCMLILGCRIRKYYYFLYKFFIFFLVGSPWPLSHSII